MYLWMYILAERRYWLVKSRMVILSEIRLLLVVVEPFYSSLIQKSKKFADILRIFIYLCGLNLL